MSENSATKSQNSVLHEFDIIVVGAGHAGVESALAAVRLGKKVLLLTMSLDSIAYMACNPSVGGTAKGHLVREIDALGGEMGKAADANLLQLRMLNTGKGVAVQSLRGQVDKINYHTHLKCLLEKTVNLQILEAEVVDIRAINNIGAYNFEIFSTLGQKFYSKAVIIATGVYLNSQVIIGDSFKNSGPSGFLPATGLSASLVRLGFQLRRFKTGTPARVLKRSIDFSKMEVQTGNACIYPFSFITDGFIENSQPCYLTYTNENTHKIIKDNILLSPMYGGKIKGTGARYCPSIEDKIMRFPDKDRHQIFIEPESASTSEMYVQGMSSSFPAHIQIEIYRSIAGLENVEIVRYAYAIEYDCIDSTTLSPSLESKNYAGLYFAGQINGTSGYEEAAAQGLIAGINAARGIDGLPPLVLKRDQAYIGVLIDDLVTKGTNEPYRMMTARAEYRLNLRQENADLRLTPIGINIGLVDAERREKFLKRLAETKKAKDTLKQVHITKLKRGDYSFETLQTDYSEFKEFSPRILAEIETEIKYAGYLAKQEALIAEQNRLETLALPTDVDYLKINGLRIEAQQKLNKIKPLNIGQAGRISGVSPADITVLIMNVSRGTFKK